MRQFVLMSLAFATFGGGLSWYLDGPSVIVVLFGLVMSMLLGAVLQKEQELVSAIDEHARARRDYEALMGNLPVGLFAIKSNNLVFANDVWSSMHSRDSGDLFDNFNSFDREELMRSLAIAERERRAFSTTLRAHTSGGTVHYEAYGAPVCDEAGELRHVLVFCVDVTPLVRVTNEVSRKHRELDEKNYQLNAALRQVEGSLEAMVSAMVRAVEIKDPYTAGHSERVRQYSAWMGEHLGLSKWELRTLNFGALIHDVGKLGIPDDILLKPAKLTPEEYGVIQRHPVYGAEIVSEVLLFKDCLPIVRWHHERLDGTGYPDGLTGDAIPFLVRIVAVADVFDAMTSNRSYRVRTTEAEALEVMSKEVAEGKLDAIAFNSLRAVIAERGIIPQGDDQIERRAA